MPISYDPTLNVKAGFFKLEDGDKPLEPRDKQTLLHLMFWLTYTKPGREFVAAQSKSKGLGRLQIEGAWKTMLETNFNIKAGPLQTALIEAHIAADEYVALIKDPDLRDKQAQLDTYDKVYQQNMSFICWTLWENSLSHEFSMNW